MLCCGYILYFDEFFKINFKKNENRPSKLEFYTSKSKIHFKCHLNS